MISEKILCRYIDSTHYRQEVANRWRSRFPKCDLAQLIVLIRFLALSRRNSITIARGMSPKRAMVAYVLGIERAAAFQFADEQVSTLMYGTDFERKQEMEAIRSSKGKSNEAIVCWSKVEFQRFVETCESLDRETKAVLRQARQAIDELKIAKDDVEYATRELNRLVNELAQGQDSKEIKPIWKRIRQVAPTISSILSAIASIARFLA